MSSFGLGRSSADSGQQHVNFQWSKYLWERLAEGGTWTIPRSGLIFRKQNDKFRLIAMMPHMPDMPITEAELAEYQEADYASVVEEFGKAGVEVVRDV